MNTKHLFQTIFLSAFLVIFVGCNTGELPLAVDQESAHARDVFLGKSSHSFPGTIPLPDGFQPEGIATGRGTSFYVGSLVNGAIYKGDLRTGAGEILFAGAGDRVAVGLSVDKRSNRLFVAGDGTGKGYVYSASTGESEMVYELTSPGSFVNDVVVSRDAAYFTDSFRPFLYRVPLGPGGDLPGQSSVEEISLSGDFVSVPGFNANGIDATPNGKHLIIVNSTTGTLYRVDPATGYAMEIDLGGDDVSSGDGILLDGRTLYVVQNFLNQIAVVRLDPTFTSGEITEILTSADFDIPTTVAEFGSSLYAVNARFTTTPTSTTSYEIIELFATGLGPLGPPVREERGSKKQ